MTQDRGDELRKSFWSKLEDSPFMMLGFAEGSHGSTRPMTAKIEGRRIWFFGSRSDDLVGAVHSPTPAIATFASKGHDFFATIEGELLPETDASMIDRLWDASVAAWYDTGRDDPEVALVRFEMRTGHLWEASTGSLLEAAYERLTGSDPAREVAEEQKAEVAL